MCRFQDGLMRRATFAGISKKKISEPAEPFCRPLRPIDVRPIAVDMVKQDQRSPSEQSPTVTAPSPGQLPRTAVTAFAAGVSPGAGRASV